jgi:SpoVK/Ycf46/Vps4 family AAA+-type ATPase
MLRLLEYHDGVVFLTTNRIQHFDPAVLSRVTISIAFTDLSPAERERVWHLLLSSSGVDESCIQVKQIAQRYDMNGRSIKNSLRLAMSLAADLRTPLSHDLLVRVIGAVLKGMRGAGEGHRAHGGGPGAPEGGHLAEDDAQRRKSQEVLEDQVSQRLRRLEVGAGCAVGMGACLAVAAGVAIGIGLGRAVGRGGSR